MEDIAAQRAAETLLAAHQANLRFELLGPPEGPAEAAATSTNRTGASAPSGTR